MGNFTQDGGQPYQHVCFFLVFSILFFCTTCFWIKKNPAYGRHQLSQPMRIVEPIQIRRGCLIYLKNKTKNAVKKIPHTGDKASLDRCG